MSAFTVGRENSLVPRQKRFRSACDICHQGKIKCSGGNPCEGCQKLGIPCRYSVSNRIGRPKGVKNRKTLDRIKNLRAEHNSTNSTENVASRNITSQIDQQDRIFERIPALNNPDSFWALLNDEQVQQSIDQFNSTELESSISLPGSGEENFDSLIFQPLPETSVRNMVAGSTSHDLRDICYANDIVSSGKDITSSRTRKEDRINLSFPTPISPRHSSPKCNFLQQQAEQVANLKVLNRDQEPLQIDSVLLIARNALTCWRGLLQCVGCRENDDQEVLLLSITGIRAVLDILKVVVRASDCSPQLRNPFEVSRSSIGSYELVSEEKQIVADVLLYRILRGIKYTLERIKRSDRNKHRSFPDITSNASTSSSSPSLLSCNSSSPLFLVSPINFPTTSADIQTEETDSSHHYLQQSLQNLTEITESLLHTLRCLQGFFPGIEQETGP